MTSESINLVCESDVELLRGQLLGTGKFRRVFKARYRGLLCAAKEIQPNATSMLIPEGVISLQKRFHNEADFYNKLNHPNIVRFIGSYLPPPPLENFPVILMELMDESLTTYAKNPSVSLKRRMSVLHDVVEGLNYLHSRGPPIVHGSLSPNHVLVKYSLSAFPVAKIGGHMRAARTTINEESSFMEFSRKLFPQHGMMELEEELKAELDWLSLVGNMFPAEIAENTSLDVFAYGGIILYTIIGEPPTWRFIEVETFRYDGSLQYTVEYRLVNLDKMTGKATVLRRLVKACLNDDQAERPSTYDLTKAIKAIKVCLSS